MPSGPGDLPPASTSRSWTPGEKPSFHLKKEPSSPSTAKASELGIHTLSSGSESPRATIDRVVSKGFAGRTIDDMASRGLLKSSSQDQLKREHRALSRRIGERLQAASWNPAKERIAALQTKGLKVTEDRRGRIEEVTVKGSSCNVGKSLGKGAMKEVYALVGGTTDITDRYVLARIDLGEVLMKTSDLKASVDGLVQEIETAQKLHQTLPNSNILVPAEIALVEKEGSYPHLYLLMEKADGQDLTTIMEDLAITETKPQLVYNLLIDSLEGLRALHQAGFLHNDFRESNILTRTAADGALRALLADFGQAVSFDEFKRDPSCLTNISQSAVDPILASLYSLMESIHDISQRDQLIDKIKSGDWQGAKTLLPQKDASEFARNLEKYRHLLQNPAKAEVWSAGLMLYRTVTGMDPVYYYHGFDLDGKLRSPTELQELLLEFRSFMFQEQIQDSNLSTYQNSPFSIMKKCISLDPNDRPTLDELIDSLKEARDNQLSLGVPPDLDDATLMPPTLADLQATGAANKIRLAQAIETWEWRFDNYTNGLQDDDGNDVILPDQMMADQAKRESQNLAQFLHSL